MAARQVFPHLMKRRILLSKAKSLSQHTSTSCRSLVVRSANSSNTTKQGISVQRQEWHKQSSEQTLPISILMALCWLAYCEEKKKQDDMTDSDLDVKVVATDIVSNEDVQTVKIDEQRPEITLEILQEKLQDVKPQDSKSQDSKSQDSKSQDSTLQDSKSEDSKKIDTEPCSDEALPVAVDGKDDYAGLGAGASKRTLIQKADCMYSNNEVKKLYQMLITYKETDSPDILWRLARATCDYAKTLDDAAMKKKLMYEAMAFSKAALDKDDSNFACHKWYGIMLDYVGDYEGTKQRIANSYLIREHFVKAIELNPTDATSIHLLGYWCFVFADLSWVQRKLAAAIFNTPPSSTYEEALEYFLEAERIDPNFYLMNQLMVAKTYIRLKNYNQAKIYLMELRRSSPRTVDDEKAIRESAEFLKEIRKQQHKEQKQEEKS